MSDPAVLYVRLVVGVILLLACLANAIRAYRAWLAENDWSSYRQFIMEVEFLAAVTLILIATDETRTLMLGLLGVLLVGAATLAAVWRKPAAD